MTRLLIFFVLLSLLWAEEDDIKTVINVSSNGVQNTMTWPNKENLKPQEFAPKLFEILKEEFYIQDFDKVLEEVISETRDDSKKSTTIVKNVYFFVRPGLDYYPEALVTFSVTTLDYDQAILNDPEKKVMPMVTIKLETPCKLYTNHFDFAVDKFDIDSIQVSITAKSSGTHWTIQNSFALKNLFLISWLSSVKRTFKITQEPKVHPILLFFKQRFDEINSQLYNKLK